MFQFKQFSVDQSNCGMKINTDGVLLGALAEADNPATILDIGTGTGVISLMLAQRYPDAHIDAVEIDEQAAATAKGNFANSQFADRLTLYPLSFEHFFTDHPEKKYDLIISNPPFYINSLVSPGAGKNLAKHADKEFFKKLVTATAKHLTPDGRLWMILPNTTAGLVKVLADNYLHLKGVVSLKSYPQSVPHREILIFGLQQANLTISEFVIYNQLNQYSAQYRTVLHDFFTIFK